MQSKTKIFFHCRLEDFLSLLTHLRPAAFEDFRKKNA